MTLAMRNAQAALLAQCHRAAATLWDGLNAEAKTRVAEELRILDRFFQNSADATQRSALEELVRTAGDRIDVGVPSRLLRVANAVLKQAATDIAGIKSDAVESASPDEILRRVSFVGAAMAGETALIVTQTRIGLTPAGYFKRTDASDQAEAELLSSDADLIREREFAANISQAASQATQDGRAVSPEMLLEMEPTPPGLLRLLMP